MFRLEKILFPVDFSEASTGATAYVAAFAGRFQSDLTLLHVVDIAPAFSAITSGIGSAQAVDFEQEGRTWARQNMNTYQTEDFKHLNVNRAVVHGDPAQQIVA